MFAEELPEALRPLVRTLDQPSARALWERHVSSDPKQRHPMVLQKPHWLDSNRWSATKWSAWENEPASSFLAKALPWAPTTEVYFVASRASSYALPWSVLLETLSTFVRHHNECSFVFSLDTLDFVLFGPHEQIGLGLRQP